MPRPCSRSTTTSRCRTRTSPTPRSGNTSSTSTGMTRSRRAPCSLRTRGTDMRAAIAALLFASGQALACGYCVEDKIAATYDHAVITHALAQKHHVAFMHVDGAASSRKVLEDALYAAPGVDRGTVRVSADLLTVSFAFDPRRSTLGVIHARAEKKLAAKQVSLMPFEVMERPARLTAVKTRP